MKGLSDMDKVIVTGGNESVYLDSATRSKLWALAEKKGIKRNELLKDIITEALKEAQS